MLIWLSRPFAGRDEIRAPLQNSNAFAGSEARIVRMRSFGNVGRVLRLILKGGLRLSPGNCILKNCEN